MRKVFAVVLLLIAGLLAAPLSATASPIKTEDTDPPVVLADESDPTDPTTPPVPVDPWLPRTGPTFNSPISSPTYRRTIIQQVLDAIAHTPAGETIRFTTYNFDRTDVERYLVAAHARGVKVQVIVNDNLVGAVERRLQARLGRNPNASSFLVICRAACRNGSGAGNMHIKMYSFTKTGNASNVMISSSGNLSGGAVNGQWNDAYTLYGDQAFFDSWLRVFNEMKADRTAVKRRLSYITGGLQIYYQKQVYNSTGKVEVARTGDAPLDRLNLVGCRAPSGYGSKGRTVMRIAMYAWYGTRGERLARAVVAAKKRGCNVAVIGSVMSNAVTRIIKGGRIPVKAADWDWGEKAPLSGGDELVFGARCYSHFKFITVSGAYRGAPVNLVWTGSENWSAPALSSDEVTMEIRSRWVLRQYNDKWSRLWNSRNATHAVYSKPTRRPCA